MLEGKVIDVRAVPKWGTPDWKRKVTTVLPLKEPRGLSARRHRHCVQDLAGGFARRHRLLAPGLAIRDGLQSRIANFDALFAPAK